MTKEKGTDILHPLDIYVYAQKRGHEKMIHFWQHDKTVRRLPIKNILMYSKANYLFIPTPLFFDFLYYSIGGLNCQV